MIDPIAETSVDIAESVVGFKPLWENAMQFFQDLGSLVERRWRDEDYSEAHFPEVAEQALAETDPSKQINPWDIIRWLSRTTQLPEQKDVDGNFGNPPITLYDGPGFYIDVYYWLDGTTTIHQHAFCGAFQVLLGSSILSQYDYKEEQKIDTHFSAGEINLNSVELLEKGDIRKIFPGKEYIHSLFHLDRPSATVVIRTRLTKSGWPQYKYLKPHFAINPFFTSAVINKRVQSAALLLSMNHPEADSLIGEMLEHSDFQTVFPILDLAYDHLSNDRLERAFGLSTGSQRFEALLEIARRRHGRLAELVLPVIEEARRQHHIIQRRGQITSNEHRFLLALLLNVPDRQKVLDLVRQRFPGEDPIDTIVDWIEELANTKVFGSAGPNVLGIDDFDEDYLFVFQCLLEDLTLAQTKSRFEDEFSVNDARSLDHKIGLLYSAIRTSMLFQSIFASSQSVSAKTPNLKLVKSRKLRQSSRPQRAKQKAGLHN